jgi:hypothetical protein
LELYETNRKHRARLMPALSVVGEVVTHWETNSA